MDKQAYVIDLINRMYDDTTVYAPEFNGYVPVISQQAYKEAANLSDIECIDPLKNLIETHSSNKTDDKRVRTSVYSILFKIASNTNEMSIFKYFEERLAIETDKHIVGDYLLGHILRSDYIPQLTSVLPFVDHKDWLIRHEAIQLLGRYRKEEVEDTLLSILSPDIDPYDIEYTLCALSNISSISVLSRIEPFLNHKKGEVRASAVATLRKVGGKDYLPVFIEMLKDRSPAVKLNALRAIIIHGDEKEIPLFITKLKTILKRERKYEPGNIESSEVIDIMKFLLQYRKQEIIVVLKNIYETKQDMLFELELKWMEEHVLVH